MQKKEVAAQKSLHTVYDDKEFSLPKYYYNSALKQALRRLFENKNREVTLPLIKWEFWGEGERHKLSIFFLSLSRSYMTKFMYDLLSRWTVPGKRVAIPLFFSSDFTFGNDDERIYLCIEAVMVLDRREDLQIAQRTMPMLEEELCLGATSFFHASRILEAKGLTLDEKADLVQEKTTRWSLRYPDFFEVDLLQKMQEFFVLSRDLFKAIRSPEHLSRMIVTFYTFSKQLKIEKEKEPKQRHLLVKLSPTHLQSPLGQKPVLGIFVGMNLLRRSEIFEEKHLFKAVQNCLEGIALISGSAYISRMQESETQNVYIEVEKKRQKRFSLEEIVFLQKFLPEEVKSHIEHLVSPIFMPRNEEEVMRNILTLSQQIKFVRDLPQVILSFDHQSDALLHFTVVIVRLLRPDDNPAADLLKKFNPERIKIVGMLKRKYPKEATVLKVRIEKAPFLREDQSLDLYRARQHVIERLEKIVGEVRDFNGGMIAKQMENFSVLKKEIGAIGETHNFLLENFFHSLFPVEARSLLSPNSIKALFELFLTMSQEKRALKNRFEWREEKGALFAIFGLQNTQLIEKVLSAVKRLNFRFPTLVFLHLHHFETTYLGYIYFSEEDSLRNEFLSLLEESLTLDA